MSALSAPTHLRCEYLENPLGIDIRQPHLFWQLAMFERGQGQSAYQVLVTSNLVNLGNLVGDMWDSGKVASDETIHIAYAGTPLVSGERYYWMVRAWDNDDVATGLSMPASFEMGLLEASNWQGSWIGAPEAVSAPLLRKAFVLKKPIAEARAYICGLGYYELSLNGRRVGDHVLDPNWTNYDDREFIDLLYPFDDQSYKRALYVTYDITEHLREGANCVGVILGNGWHNQRERTIEGKMWWGAPRLLVQINIRYADGTRESVVSDGTWTYSPSAITFNNLFYGEVYDARLEQPGWDTADFADAGWKPAVAVERPSGKLCAQMSPPDKVIGTLPPVARTQPKPGVYVFDLGQNFAGWARLRVSGPAGAQVQLRFAEELFPDGTLSFLSSTGEENDGGQIQRDVYILNGVGEEVYTPRFTWHCFRYVEVTGFPGEPPLDAIEGLIVHSAVESAGDFFCSNETINAIQRLYRATQLANYHGGVPSDCPHRERLGYTGDGQLTVEAALYNFHVIPFYRKWLQDISDAQNHKTGFVPHTAPFYGGGGGPAWGAAYPIVAWYLYKFTGDRRILEEHYDGIKAWVDYLATCTDEDGIVVHEEPGSWCLGDWSLPGVMALPGSSPLPVELVNTAYYGVCARLLAHIAALLGKTKEAVKFTQLEQATQAAFHARFFDAARGCYSTGRYGTEAFALVLGAVPEDEQPRVVAHMAQTVRDNGGHLDTGILGTPWLLDTLVDHGHADLAFEIVTKTTYPSYGYMLERGATTMWENWAEENGSHCHPMYGSVSGWFYRILAGIYADPFEPGFKRVTIMPQLIGELTFAASEVETLRGTVAVKWEKRADGISLRVSVPVGAAATIFLPETGVANPTITESSFALWENGVCVSDVSGSGITDIFRYNPSPAMDAIVVLATGGEYEFLISR